MAQNNHSEKVILLLEDDPEQAALYADILFEQGFVVYVAQRMEQALRILAAYGHRVDHVLTDNMIGRFSAGQLVRDAARTLGIPCHVYSGSDSRGVDLSKPMDWVVVKDLILRSIRPQTYSL